MTARKDKVDDVIETNGSDITVRTNTINSTRDAWGRPVVDSSADRTIKAVKDNYLKYDAKLNSSGRFSGASSALIVKGDESFTPRTDEIIFDGITYNILQIQPLELAGEVLGQLLLLGEK